MATTTRIYRSTDASAPVVARLTAGSFVEMLEACLVDGYGSKDPAGWTTEFTDTSKRAFRNSVAEGGTGCYVLVDDTSTGSGRSVAITTYREMTSISSGSDATHTNYLARSPAEPNGGHANPIEWIVVADELTFYVGVSQLVSGSTHYRLFGGAGDIESLAAGDSYRYFSMGQGAAYTNMNPGGSFITVGNSRSGFGYTLSNNQGLSLGRDYTGTGGASPHGIVAPTTNTTTWAIGGGLYPPRPSLNSADEVAMPAYIARAGVMRGKLRGLLVPVANLSPLGQGHEKSGTGFLGTGSVSVALTYSFTAIGSSSSDSGGLWVEAALPWS